MRALAAHWFAPFLRSALVGAVATLGDIAALSLLIEGCGLRATAANVPAQRATNPDPGEIFKDCADCPELVVVPSGDFVMGANDTPYEKPERTIAIRNPFAIGHHEVTFAE